MKTLCLFILTFLALYNAKVEANMSEFDIRPLDNYANELTKITILKVEKIKFNRVFEWCHKNKKND